MKCLVLSWLIFNELALPYFLRSSQTTSAKPTAVNTITPSHNLNSSGVM